jgi:hypothetical protein
VHRKHVYVCELQHAGVVRFREVEGVYYTLEVFAAGPICSMGSIRQKLLYSEIRPRLIEGARANGLERKIGTLTPGKDADIILLRTDQLNVMPMNNAVGAVVTSMGPQNVDTVLIAGKVMKRNGQLVGVDFARLGRLGEEARDRLYSNAKVKNVRL